VTEDVVEDIRLRNVIERSRWTYRHRRREAAPRKRLEEQLRLEEPLHRHRAPAGLRFETRIHLVEVRDAITLQADHLDPFQERAGRVLLEMFHTAVV